MRESSRVRPRAIAGLAIALASVALLGATAMAAVTVTDIPVPVPTVAGPVDGADESLTTDIGSETPRVPDVSTGALEPGVDDLIGGTTPDTEPASQEPTPEPTAPGAVDPTASSPGSNGGPTSGRSDTSPAADIQDVHRTGTRLPAGSGDAIDRALRLARPFAPAVVIAALGLLALAGAARGNDRLVKRDADGAAQVAWRL